MEIKNRIIFYNDFVPDQTSTSILKTIYDYLKKQGSYMLPIIDIMLLACATELNPLPFRTYARLNAHHECPIFATCAPSTI